MDDLLENSFQPRTKARKAKRSLKKAPKIKGPTEDTVQIMYITWLKQNHPNVIYSADASGIKLTIGQATKAKRSGLINRSHPDTTIHEPTDNYGALFLELKRDDTKIYKVKTPDEFASPHLKEQADRMKALNAKGYCATFAIGFQEARDITIKYLNNEKIEDKYKLGIL